MLKVHLVLILSLININMFDARLLRPFRGVSRVSGGERKIRRLQHNINIILIIKMVILDVIIKQTLNNFNPIWAVIMITIFTPRSK